ncbi:MAG TPA: PAS domain-containing sensor histidine kinase [Noviherbaspirillum sp.]|nr:PAS domain-containing sensor histidine kinase [Noviherbaspirillum sp.]
MTTHLEHFAGNLPNFITTLPEFPANKVDRSLLAVIDSSMDAVIIVDSMRQIVLVNHKAERIFGYPAQQLLQKPLDMLLPSRFSGEQRRRMERLAVARIHGQRSSLELKGLRANGESISLNANISRVAVRGELFLALFLKDPGARKSGMDVKQRPVRDSELRRWVVSSQHATEVEKKRFSKKLYDDIGQRLSVLKLDLDWLENSLSDADDCFPTRLAQMQGLLDNVIRMTKSMASALRPPLLDDFGLLPAVEWIAVNFQKKTSINCTVESNGLDVKLDDPIESAIFRVIQEGLANIEQHAQARNARISFTHTMNQLDVMIRDDGIGMESGSENKPGCYGLIAMQERIFVLGGTISIRNVKPHGVAIHASIPIEPIFKADQTSPPPTSNL